MAYSLRRTTIFIFKQSLFKCEWNESIQTGHNSVFFVTSFFLPYSSTDASLGKPHTEKHTSKVCFSIDLHLHWKWDALIYKGRSTSFSTFIYLFSNKWHLSFYVVTFLCDAIVPASCQLFKAVSKKCFWLNHWCTAAFTLSSRENLLSPKASLSGPKR